MTHTYVLAGHFRPSLAGLPWLRLYATVAREAGARGATTSVVLEKREKSLTVIAIVHSEGEPDHFRTMPNNPLSYNYRTNCNNLANGLLMD